MSDDASERAEYEARFYQEAKAAGGLNHPNVVPVLESGENNWVLTPSADLLNSDILARVRLDKITLTGGTVNYRDRRRGETVRLDDINADVASPGVAGPWRMRAKAIYQDRPVDVAINTAAYVEGQPFLFGFKVQPADSSGTVYSFDGAYTGGLAQGDVRVAPAQRDDGKRNRHQERESPTGTGQQPTEDQTGRVTTGAKHGEHRQRTVTGRTFLERRGENGHCGRSGEGRSQSLHES